MTLRSSVLPGNVIVSITPVALRRDSRTLREATSVARFGYRSRVVEGQPSGFAPGALPFDVVSMSGPRWVARERRRGERALRRREAELRKATCSVPSPAPSSPAIRGTETVCSRVVRNIRKLSNAQRSLLEHWWRSEPLRFLRHLCDYIMTYVVDTLRCTPKAGLYYLHSFQQFPAVYLLCLRYKAKFIYDAHDFYSQMYDCSALSRYTRRWVLPFEAAIESACIRRAAEVVTVNQGIANLIEHRFGRAAVVLRNAHDPRCEKPVDLTVKDIVNAGGPAFLLVCVGQFKEGMAVAEAIHALAALPKACHLAFLGPGYPDYRELLKQQGVADRVHFLSAMEPAQVVPFIRTADAGIVLYYALSPSHENCLPNGFFQTVAAGLPVLYPELPEIKRIAQEHELGVPIEPRDPRSIAAGVARLMNDRLLMQQLRMNAQRSRSKLSWEQDEHRLQKLIADVVGAPRGSAAPLSKLAGPAESTRC